MAEDYISRQAAIDAIDKYDFDFPQYMERFVTELRDAMKADLKADIKDLPSEQPEPLTDKEQRIFLAAMGREMKVCEEVDRNYTREPYEDSLVKVCREIERKVKKALWMI